MARTWIRIPFLIYWIGSVRPRVDILVTPQEEFVNGEPPELASPPKIRKFYSLHHCMSFWATTLFSSFTTIIWVAHETHGS